MSRFMISLCPHCNVEQMVTAIALQEKRGVVTCIACADDFKPRAHRVTPSRERAFKQREREQRIEAEVRATQAERNLGLANAAEAAAQASAALKASESPGETASASNKLAPDAESVAEVFLQRLGTSIDALGERFGERLASSLRDGILPIANSGSPDVALPSKSAHDWSEALSEQEQIIAADLAQQNLNRPRSEEGEQNMKNETGSKREQRSAPAEDKLQKARQTIARQKMLLDYQKLRHESEKLEVEKKKLELERVKLEIMRKHNLLENNKLQPAEAQNAQHVSEARPVIEYDVRADILPRTPTAIEPDPRVQKPASAPQRVAARRGNKAVHLELMPSEPKSIFRRNIGTKANKLK